MGGCFSTVNSNANTRPRTQVRLRMAVMGDHQCGKTTLIKNCFTENISPNTEGMTQMNVTLLNHEVNIMMTELNHDI